MRSLQEIKEAKLNVYFIGGIRYEIPPQVEQALEILKERKDEQINALKLKTVKWHPYPETKPPNKIGIYLVSMKNAYYPVRTSIWEGTTFQDSGVYAWAEVPPPYQPKREE